MVWYNLQVGKYNLKYTPLKAESQDYPYCDKDGNILNKVFEGEGKKSFFVDSKGNKHNQTFRLINNKPLAKLEKTKAVENFKEVESNEIDDLLSEKEYLIDCEFLLQDLKNSGKALKFGFTNGNGFKVFKAYIYVDKLYSMLFMKLGRTQKSEILKGIKELMKNKKQAESISLTIEGVNKAKVEDLIQI